MDNRTAELARDFSERELVVNLFLIAKKWSECESVDELETNGTFEPNEWDVPEAATRYAKEAFLLEMQDALWVELRKRTLAKP